MQSASEFLTCWFLAKKWSSVVTSYIIPIAVPLNFHAVFFPCQPVPVGFIPCPWEIRGIFSVGSCPRVLLPLIGESDPTSSSHQSMSNSATEKVGDYGQTSTLPLAGRQCNGPSLPIIMVSIVITVSGSSVSLQKRSEDLFLVFQWAHTYITGAHWTNFYI